ncbi:MAG TPA: S-adenosylmethionine:tRNA ribosyltransferase-isomerase [Puia sp.]|jgi:S-adenosylmethionine:tRNA ribosyltransferase-isomerase|nr:S-adenosylmethionine:tRNA ribosyltransferase-isomerase [Puia sp.]
MHPKDISILDYTYNLPEEKIAKYPLTQRDASKLLVYKNGNISDDSYRNITQRLPENPLLIFNDTKVVEARIIFQKSSGATIEIFCLEPFEIYGDIPTGFRQQQRVLWKCLIGGASKWKHGQVLEKKIMHHPTPIVLQACFIKKQDDYFIIEFVWKPGELHFAELLHVAGRIPLPPYIKRETEAQDAERYQTVYAKRDGSVAAPTAGLHFSDSILHQLNDKLIPNVFVTLHVGAGTFKPVKSKRLEQHVMHAEFMEVSIATIKFLFRSLDSNIIPVGTTSLRTIESLYWLGLKTIAQPDIRPENLIVRQWEPYEISNQNMHKKISLQSLIEWMEKNSLHKLITTTQLLIAPGYQFKIINGLITNFHQPQSTLLLLVAALIGEDWKKVYEHALNNNFRFLSYGDGCLFFGKEYLC